MESVIDVAKQLSLVKQACIIVVAASITRDRIVLHGAGHPQAANVVYQLKQPGETKVWYGSVPSNRQHCLDKEATAADLEIIAQLQEIHIPTELKEAA